ncbi:MAG: hypothetical protein Q9208_005379 [Pyrenodesmia sp. 3 TL-2023]
MSTEEKIEHPLEVNFKRTKDEIAKVLASVDRLKTDLLAHFDQKPADASEELSRGLLADTNKFIEYHEYDICLKFFAVRHWRTRLPVKPLTPLPDETAKHIIPSPGKPEAISDTVTSDFWEQKPSYAVSYINQSGEGPTSDWVQVEEPIAKGVTEIILTLHPVMYSGDPLAGFQPVKNAKGDDVPPTKGLQRRIYASYLPPHAQTTRKVLVAETGEHEVAVEHHINREKE